MTIRAAATCCVLLTSSAALWADGDGLAQVVTVDGDSFAGKITAVAKGRVAFDVSGKGREVAFADLRSVRLGDADDPMKRTGRKVLILSGGEDLRLGGEKVSFKDGKFSIESDLLGPTVVDISVAAALYLPRPDQNAGGYRVRHLELRLPPASHDYLLAENRRGGWVQVPGVLKTIGTEKVTFEYRDEARTVDVASTRVIELARMGGEKPASIGTLVGRDGSRVPFKSVTLSGKTLAIQADGIQCKGVALSKVAELRFASSRFVHLSSLTPSKAAQTGLFDVTFRFQTDRSAAGGPITLRGRTYAKGLGLHSRCELTYRLDGKYVKFATLAGIDDAAQGRGKAELKILGDGKELVKPVQLTGRDRPQRIRCDVSGVKALTIVVGFGDDGVDVGDHVSLADARLIKP